jgi:hypothetical protein
MNILMKNQAALCEHKAAVIREGFKHDYFTNLVIGLENKC